MAHSTPKKRLVSELSDSDEYEEHNGNQDVDYHPANDADLSDIRYS